MDGHFLTKKVAFQFSGGKDSRVALQLLRPYWDRMTVYWLNTGDAVPEVEEAVYEIAKFLPHFVEVEGNVKAHRAEFGMPSDIVASDATVFGAESLGHTIKIQDRGQCCFFSFMKPLHDRMIADGIEVIVRGQKLADKRKSPLRSGDVVDGFQFYFPIEHWSEEDVLAYLKNSQWGLPEYYNQLKASQECLSCTAYLTDYRRDFLETRYPVIWAEVRSNLEIISATALEAMAPLIKHLED